MTTGYDVYHDWQGLVSLVAPDGRVLRTLAKIAAGTPGSGIPVDANARLTTARLQRLADRLNKRTT